MFKSATARLVELSSASSVNYPFTLDNVTNYVIKYQLDLLEVASSDFQGPKKLHFRLKKNAFFLLRGEMFTQRRSETNETELIICHLPKILCE